MRSPSSGSASLLAQIRERDLDAGDRIAQLVREGGGDFAGRRQALRARQALLLFEQSLRRSADLLLQRQGALAIGLFQLLQPIDHLVVVLEQRKQQRIDAVQRDRGEIAVGQAREKRRRSPIGRKTRSRKAHSASTTRHGNTTRAAIARRHSSSVVLPNRVEQLGLHFILAL